MKRDFAVGDIIRYTSKFLKSVGWYTDVPRNGKVLAVEPFRGFRLITVQWCDRDEPSRINASNVELDPTVKQ